MGIKLSDYEEENCSLIGNYFIAPQGEENYWQGYILDEPKNGYFLVQLNSWVTGHATGKHKIVAIETILEWDIYLDAEDWRNAGDAIMANIKRDKEIDKERQRREIDSYGFGGSSLHFINIGEE
jgi:hypothetical protein